MDGEQHISIGLEDARGGSGKSIGCIYDGGDANTFSFGLYGASGDTLHCSDYDSSDGFQGQKEILGQRITGATTTTAAHYATYGDGTTSTTVSDLPPTDGIVSVA